MADLIPRAPRLRTHVGPLFCASFVSPARAAFRSSSTGLRNDKLYLSSGDRKGIISRSTAYQQQLSLGLCRECHHRCRLRAVVSCTKKCFSLPVHQRVFYDTSHSVRNSTQMLHSEVTLKQRTELETRERQQKRYLLLKGNGNQFFGLKRTCKFLGLEKSGHKKRQIFVHSIDFTRRVGIREKKNEKKWSSSYF